MKSLDVSKATDSLAQYARDLNNEAVVVTSRGRPMALLMPVGNEDDLESLSLSTNPKFLAIIEKSRDSFREKGGIPLDEVRRRLKIPAKKAKSRKK